ncbi:hypothetical protein ACLIKD_04730 [Azonexus sp. IMCC34842]|jgi:hypothetical protein|uniref:hypothetical protein n=1 Tax=Azonexus sp. IMCC34842 TaxID=3420950 RepID=UPI003D124DB1
MDHPSQQPGTTLTPLTLTWLALVALTLLSLGLGQWLHGAAWLQLLVAGIVWIKGWLVAQKFIEAELAHPFIRRVLKGFIAFTPVALVLTAFYGPQFARWATL